MKTRERKATRAALLMLLLLLSGCSSIKLAYNQLDWWLRWKLDAYLDLEGPQKQQLAAAVGDFHRWHRHTQLPLYADFLEQLAHQVTTEPYSRAQLDTAEARLETFYRDSAGKLADLLLPLLSELTQPQIDTLARNLQREHEKSQRKRPTSEQKAQRTREREMRKQSRRWLGRLTAEQDQWIREWAAQIETDPAQRDRQRQLWQGHFIEALRRKPPGYQESLRELLLDPRQLWPEDYARIQEQRRQQTQELGEKLIGSISPRQRQHLADTLRGYAADFRSLAADGH